MEHIQYAKGITWIDDCRIPFVDEKDPNISRYAAKRDSVEGMFNRTVGFKAEYDYKEQKGRFPANILVSDDMLNDGVISKSTIFDGKLPNIRGGRFGASDVELTDKRALGGFNDKGTNSRYYDIDKWFESLLESCE